MAGLNDFFKSPETLASKITGWHAARARTHAGEGFIYLADLGNGRVKIGFSLNPEKRVRSLRSWYFTDSPARLLAKVPGTWAQEKALHHALNGQASKNEVYPRSILSHAAIPAELRSAA